MTINPKSYTPLIISEELHDYTELVIELWTAYMFYGFSLSNLGGGDSTHPGAKEV